MSQKLVIGIDSSTQSTKAVAWSDKGEVLGEGRSPIAMSNPRQDQFEQNPDNWWSSCCDSLRQLGEQIDFNSVEGLAISNQRETVAFLDSDFNAVRPAMVWLDERVRNLLEPFCEKFPANDIHRITGKPVDATPVLYRLYWMRLHEAENLDRTAQIVDAHGYLTGKLTGTCTASWTSADPFGIFDIEQKEWSIPLLEQIGVRLEQLPKVERTGTEIGCVGESASKETGLKAGIPIFAAGGDGQCAGLGVNAMRQGTAYLNLGTAVVVGVWDSKPRMSKSWRTMTSPTGDGYFFEGVLRAGTYLIDWYVKNFSDRNGQANIMEILEKEAKEISVGSEGLIVSPYLSGCMNPYWTMDVSAAFFGMRPMHTSGHLYRAILESLTGEIARCLQDMRAEGVGIERIICVGGGANSDMWLQMIADSTGLPIDISNSLEASALGAGITAAVGAGWYSDFDSAAAAMCKSTHVKNPISSAKSEWEKLLKRQNKLNQIVVENCALGVQ